MKCLISQGNKGHMKKSHSTLLMSDGRIVDTPESTSRLNVERLFLPCGFPKSVASYYPRYAALTFLQVSLNNVNRILATQAMLLSVGAGSAGLPIAAAINWVLKDGIGQLGSILVSSLINRNFDSDPKRYRFQAVLLGQLSNLLSLLSLPYPAAFLALTSISSTLSRIGTVAHLSSRVRIYDDMAIERNVGDIMRCSQAQSTAASLFGTAVGVALAPSVLTSPSSVMVVFAPLAIATQYLAYQSSSLVVLSTFNLQRAQLVFDKIQSSNHFMTPAQVSEIETFVFPYHSLIRVNPPLHAALATHIDDLRNRKFAIIKDTHVTIWLASDATAEDAVHAVYAAINTGHDRWQEVRDQLSLLGWRFDVSFIDEEKGRLEVLKN